MPTHALLKLIGNTPLVQITQMDTGPCQLFVKLESQNPGGSIKDRIGLSIIEAAERDGSLQPGGTIVEATAGNTQDAPYRHQSELYELQHLMLLDVRFFLWTFYLVRLIRRDSPLIDQPKPNQVLYYQQLPQQ